MRWGSTWLPVLFLLPAMNTRAQVAQVTVSGIVRDSTDQRAVAYANVVLKKERDSSFAAGSVTSEDGRFVLAGVQPGNYLLELRFTGYVKQVQPLVIGSLSDYLDLGVMTLAPDRHALAAVVVTGRPEELAARMDKKTFTLADNISQAGGSVLATMKNLPGVTVTQDGTVQLRGSDRVAVLIDGRQTALTGFGNQTSLDNIPASAIERIEIINNPSAKYDANGNAGIINIIYKKEKQDGLNGKAGLAGGLGALWVKKENYPGIRPQYQRTPKVNPSLSLNYRKKDINVFFQGDYLLKQTLNKNEFVQRTYDDGTIILQQTKRNRTTQVGTAKLGADWKPGEHDLFTLSGLFSSEKILDRGDEPFYNGTTAEMIRLWQFLEDELKTTATASASYQHRFAQPGRLLNIGFNYTFHRENEQYSFTNTLPTYTGEDAFRVLSDEHVADLNADYIRPLKYGRFETGLKFRRRYIPTNMQFIPGLHSPLDTNAGGWANYSEIIPAAYGNYVLESRRYELEAGLRIEYVDLRYTVNPGHNTYHSDGYSYAQPFPNVRLAYKINDRNKLSFFYNRRVDRPNEGDIRIFPKYDDAEIIKVGNPGLKPQFTNRFELGYRTGTKGGYVYAALYHNITDGTITRIATVVPGSTLIYNVFQNAGRSYNTGIELTLSKQLAKRATLNLNMNGYRNTIEAFTVENLYPQPSVFAAQKQQLFSGNVKANGLFHLQKKVDVQLSAVYMAPDLIPQGRVGSRFSLDLGMKKSVQSGKGELFINATDLLNTMRVKRTVQGDGFRYTSTDYYETQVIRAGYSYIF